MEVPSTRRNAIEDLLALALDIEDRAGVMADALAPLATNEDYKARNRLRMGRKRRQAAIRNPRRAA